MCQRVCLPPPALPKSRTWPQAVDTTQGNKLVQLALDLPPPTLTCRGPPLCIVLLSWRISFAAAVVTVVVYYLVFQGKNMFKEPLTASDIFLFGEFQDSVSGSHGFPLSRFVFSTLYNDPRLSFVSLCFSTLYSESVCVGGVLMHRHECRGNAFVAVVRELECA